MSFKVTMNCLKRMIIAGFLLIFQSTNAQQNFSDLTAILEQKQQLLGKDLVMMVANKDTIIYKKEMGEFKSKTAAPIASASKWLTAALVMVIVDEGKISLDDKVVTYIPEFGKYFKNYITIRQCLGHMTGIADESGGLLKKLASRRKFETLEEEVNSFAAREIQEKPGAEFRYSNMGLNIAGRILEVVTKKKFDQLAKLKLFGPLGMRQTSFTNIDMSAVNPSGGAKSTADDYMKFLTMLLNKGNYKGNQILTEESVEAMMQAQTTSDQIKYAPKSAEGFNYASGSWVIEEKDGKATALASPGLFGTWPMIDFCRGYSYIVFVKNLLGEERAGAHIEIKEVVDSQFKSKCN
jgi:CubicO group peptidase (beta-lactamase class C family)